MKKYVIAVDGGGTKTVGTLADLGGEVYNYKVCGASNPNDIGEEASAKMIASLVRKLADECDGWITAVYAGISGAVGHEKVLRRAIHKACPDTTVRVESDVYNLFGLLPGDPDRDSAAIICGTGSVCFVRKDGELHRIGGWGYLLDSNGGAYSVGRDALEAALRQADGRGQKTSLYERATAYLGDVPEHCIGKIYQGGKPFIAGFAPEAFRAAEENDAVARCIVDKAVTSIEEYLNVAKSILGGDGFDCIVGGGMMNDPMMKKSLSSIDGVNIIYPEREQVFGALNQALKMIERE